MSVHKEELRNQNIDIKIDPNAVVVFVHSTILKPEPIAVAEDSSSGSSSCIIAVGEDVRNKVVVLIFRYTVLYTILEPEPTQDKAV